jgi:hypothetical protein
MVARLRESLACCPPRRSRQALSRHWYQACNASARVQSKVMAPQEQGRVKLSHNFVLEWMVTVWAKVVKRWMQLVPAFLRNCEVTHRSPEIGRCLP